MSTIEEINSWEGQDAYGPNDQKIGQIAEIYVDQDTGQPEWAAVKTGMFGSKRLAPLAEARADGDHVQLPFDKETVKHAPKIGSDDEPAQEEVAELYRFYGMSYSESPADATASPADATASPMDAGQAHPEPTSVATHEIRDPDTADVMTRSDEDRFDGVDAWEGQDVCGPDGQKIGEIAEIYLDQDTGRPEWIAVKTGMFGAKHLAPLAEARADEDALQLPYDKATIENAPKIGGDDEPAQEEVAELYRFYGLAYVDSSSDPDVAQDEPSGRRWPRRR